MRDQVAEKKTTVKKTAVKKKVAVKTTKLATKKAVAPKRTVAKRKAATPKADKDKTRVLPVPVEVAAPILATPIPEPVIVPAPEVSATPFALSSILDQKNVPVRLLNPKMDEWRDNSYGYTWQAHTFPEDIVIMDVRPYAGVTYSITYMSTTTAPRNVYVHKDIKMVSPPKEIKDSLLALIEKHTFDNLKTMLGHAFTIGSDPEIFAEDENGNVIPAFHYLGGKKDGYLTAPGTYGNQPMYWDGFQAEFTTAAPTCLAWQVDSVQCGLKGVYDAMRKKFPKGKLSSRTVMDISYEQIHSASEEHVEFGCMPSYNAYGIKVPMAPGREVFFRSAGGHIHYGMGKMTEAQANPIVKALDAILGVACVALFASYDNPIRRTMYGLPGEYRLPPHGLEYRTLSNAWLCHPTIMNLVFDLSRKVVVFGQKGMIKYWNATEAETIETIIKCDVAKAKEILDRNKNLLCKLLEAAYNDFNTKQIERLFSTLRNGMETVIKDPSDIVTNWNLKGDWYTHSDGANKNVHHSANAFASNIKI